MGVSLNFSNTEEYNIFVKDVALEISNHLNSTKSKPVSISKREAMKLLKIGFPRINELINNRVLKLDVFGQILYDSYENYKLNGGV